MERALPFLILAVVIMLAPAVAGQDYEPTKGVVAVWGMAVIGCIFAAVTSVIFAGKKESLGRGQAVRIAEHIAAELKRAGLCSVSWGDPILVDSLPERTRRRNSHPLAAMKSACDALDRAPDLFTKAFIKAHDKSGTPRVVRSFRLIDKS